MSDLQGNTWKGQINKRGVYARVHLLNFIIITAISFILTFYLIRIWILKITHGVPQAESQTATTFVFIHQPEFVQQ